MIQSDDKHIEAFTWSNFEWHSPLHVTLPNNAHTHIDTQRPNKRTNWISFEIKSMKNKKIDHQRHCVRSVSNARRDADNGHPAHLTLYGLCIPCSTNADFDFLSATFSARSRTARHSLSVCSHAPVLINIMRHWSVRRHLRPSDFDVTTIAVAASCTVLQLRHCWLPPHPAPELRAHTF